MERLKGKFRRILGVYRRSRLLAAIVDETRWAWRVWVAPQKEMDQAHLRRDWDFEKPPEQKWHLHVLAVLVAQLGEEDWGDTLEIGCSAGGFTTYLARRCRSIAAYDFSPIACGLTAERFAQYPNVRIGRLDLVKDDIPGQYDLVFAMDVMECIMTRRHRKLGAAAKLANALRSGGLLVYTDCRLPKAVRGRWWLWWLPQQADEWAPILTSTPGLRLVFQETYSPEGQSSPGYPEKIIALFRKEA